MINYLGKNSSKINLGKSKLNDNIKLKLYLGKNSNQKKNQGKKHFNIYDTPKSISFHIYSTNKSVSKRKTSQFFKMGDK